MDIIDHANDTTAREYLLSRLSAAFSSRIAQSVDWNALGFPLEKDIRWISDSGSCYAYNEHVSVGVYTFCALEAENRDISKNMSSIINLMQYTGEKLLPTENVASVVEKNRTISNISPLSDCSFDMVEQYAEYVAGIICFRLGTPVNVTRWDLPAIRELMQSYKQLGVFLGDYTDDELKTIQCYDVTFPVYWQGLRLYTGNDNGMPGETVLLSMPLRLLMSHYGVLILSLPLFEELSPVDKMQTIISYDKAIELFINLYDNMYIPHINTITVNKLTLEYVAISGDQIARKGFTLYPAWCFQTEVVQNDGIRFLETRCFHAITGKQLK